MPLSYHPIKSMQKPSPDRPWAITYTVGVERFVMSRHPSRADAEMAIARAKRMVTYPMLIIWDGELQALTTQ